MNLKTAWIAAALIAGVMCMGAIAQAQDPTNPDWPTFRGPGTDGHVAGLPAAVPAKKLIGQQKVAGVCEAGIAVAEGCVVVCDADEAKDYYRCYDLDLKQEKWTTSYDNGRQLDPGAGAGPRATPVINKGKVYVLSAFGELRCLNLADGKEIWKKEYAKDFVTGDTPSWGFCSSPLIAGGKLIINPGGKPALAALDLDKGTVLWEGKASGNNYSSFIAGKFGGVEQVVGFDADSLGGWAVADGKRLWKVKVNPGPGYIVPAPVKVGEKLFMADAANDGVLFEFGKDGVINPKPVATSDALKPEVISSVAVGNLILGCHNGLVCLDAGKPAEDWKPLWTNEDGDPYKRTFHLIVSGNTLLSFNDKGVLGLATFDDKGVKIIGTVKLCGETIMHPTVAGGRIYMRDAKGLYCYDLGMAK